MTEKRGFISSITSRSKNKKILEENSMVENIGVLKYKYKLYKAIEASNYADGVSKCFDFIEDEDLSMFHIVDENLAKNIYEALVKGKINTDNLPEAFKNLKFVTINSKQKVVFIASDGLLGNCYKSQLLEDLYDMVTWFCETFSTSEKVVNFSYKSFTYDFLDKDQSFWNSFFKAIYVSEAVCELDTLALDHVINILLHYCNPMHCIGLSKIRENIQNDDVPFYKFLKRGIYMKEIDDYGFRKLPYNIYINIFKYALNENCFNAPIDFFKEVNTENKYDSLLDMNIIFDERVFNKSLKEGQTSNHFTSFTYKDKKGPNFLLLKDNNEFEHIKQVLEELMDEELVSKKHCLYCPNTDKYYLCDYDNYRHEKSLSGYIESIGKNEAKITNLILLLNDTFLSKASVRQKVFASKDTNWLDLLYTNHRGDQLSFFDISKICFSKKEDIISFQYPLCIMQVVQKYMTVNSILLEDIYKCSFIKLLPKTFTDELITYLKTKEYQPKGMVRKLKEILTEKNCSKVVFLEDIINEPFLFNKVSFLPEYSENLFVKDITKRTNKPESNFSNVECISLNERMRYITDRCEDLHLSNKAIAKISFEKETYGRVLFPEKVIISKDIYDEQNYKIIGVVWNKFKLYTLEDLLKANVINVKNVYKTLVKSIFDVFDSGYRIDFLNSPIGSLLLEDNFKIVFDCNTFNQLADIFDTDRISMPRYYSKVMQCISNEIGGYLDNFTLFTFKELAPIYDGSLQALRIFKSNIENIGYCKEHSKLHLANDLCPMCKKIYHLTDNASYKGEVRYDDGVALFRIYLGNLLWNNYPNADDNYISKQITRRVKLGIENGIYEKFVGVVPKKVAVTRKARENAVAIVCDEYDFSNVMLLESFKDVQKLKAVLLLYRNVLPYILDYSFITSDIRVFNTMFMDRNYKGEIIIPNLPLLNTEIYTSSDEALRKQEQEKTLKCFSNFLYEYLSSDEVFKSELKQNDVLITKIFESIKECNFNEEDIKKYLQTKKSFCKVHGRHFSEEDIICPECILDGIPKEKIVIKDKAFFDSLKSKKGTFEGGEANLYISKKTGKLYKLFNDKVNLSFKSKIIAKALQKADKFREFNNNHEDIKFVPIDEVLYSYKDGVLNLEGYTQELIADSFKISSFKEKTFVDEKEYKRKDIVEILIKTCKGIEFLHSINGFIGDLNGGNILVKDKAVYIIDMDGMSFDDVKNCVYTNLYIYPPSAENKNITKLDDWYSFAIQAFYYLTYSHPFRGICKNKKVPLDEMQRMTKGYSILGNHGIKIPKISIGWDLMPKQMIDFFLNTFEGSKRESMLSVLESYLEQINKNEMDLIKIQRKNPSFIEISENVYIDNKGVLYYKETPKLTGLKANYIEKEVNILQCDEYIMFCYEEYTFIINDKTGEIFKLYKVYPNDYTHIYHINENKIYYVSLPETKKLYIDEFDKQTGNITTKEVKRVSQNNIWVAQGTGNEKIVILEEDGQNGTYDVVINDTLIVSLPMSKFITYDEADAFIDDVTKSTIIVFNDSNDRSQNKCIVVDNNHKVSEFSIGEKLSESMCFYKNTLYFVGDRKIYMYNVGAKVLRSIYCNVTTPQSGITRVDNKFIIRNEKESYMYVKS